jgi:hypothetical protein
MTGPESANATESVAKKQSFWESSLGVSLRTCSCNAPYRGLVSRISIGPVFVRKAH